MKEPQKVNIHEDSDFKKIVNIIAKNYKYFVICVIIAVGLAFINNYLTVPVYKVTSSILIKEDSRTARQDINDFLNSNMFGTNQGIQNEFYILKIKTAVVFLYLIIKERIFRKNEIILNYFQEIYLNFS